MTYQLVLAGARRTRRMKAIAYVDANAGGESMRFAETIAVNRFVPMAVFRTVADAQRWILGEGEKGGTES